jgi:hypothetical protein
MIGWILVAIGTIRIRLAFPNNSTIGIKIE